MSFQYGSTALHSGAQSGVLDFVRFVVEELHLDVNQTDDVITDYLGIIHEIKLTSQINISIAEWTDSTSLCCCA